MARTTATAIPTTFPGTTASKGRPTTPRSCALRERQKRNMLATLLLSQGTPMLLAGDEFGRTPERQQQRLLPGQRAELDRLDGDRRGRPVAHRVHAEADRAAPDLPHPAPPALPHRAAQRRARRARRALGVADRRADAGRAVERRQRALPRHGAGRAGAGDRHQPAGDGRDRAAGGQRAPRRGALHAAGGDGRHGLALPARHQRRRRSRTSRPSTSARNTW